MAINKDDYPKDAEHSHFHGVSWVDKEATLTDVETRGYTDKRKVTWSQLRRTAPDLYIVSLIIFFFGIAVVISAMLSIPGSDRRPAKR